MASSPKAHPISLHRLAQSLPHYISQADSKISRVNQLLNRTSSLDTTLCTLTYTLQLLHASLTRLTSARLSLAAHHLAAKLAAVAPDALLPDETLIATITPSPTSAPVRLAASAKALFALIDDVRLFLRLGGLFAVWTHAAATWRHPPTDRVLRAVTWAQVAAGALFQALENAAYLASKGVVGWRPRVVVRCYVWSARFWMAYVLLEFGRLAREYAMRGEGVGEDVGARVGVTKEEVDGWWRRLYINAAWAPLTVHWSVERGAVSEMQIALLGMCAGFLELKESWKTTA